MKMSELQEKRDYYPDRSLKSIYFVDEQGRKQGEAVIYEQNSQTVKCTEDYVDGKLRARRFDQEYQEFDKNGVCRKKQYKAIKGDYQIIKEYDKNGLISHDFHNDEVYNKFWCRLVRINKVDLYYKNGKPWEGDVFEVRTDGTHAKYFDYGHDGGCIVNEQHYKGGKLNGTYVDTYSDGASDWLLRETRGEKANFKDGVLDGEYEARCSNMRKPDFKFIKFSEYGIEPKSINYSGSYRINGNFIQGVFSGSIECGYQPNNLYVIENGKLKRSVEYLGEKHWIEKNYEDGKLVRASEKIVERMVVFVEQGTYGHEGISSLNEVEYKEGKLHGTSKKFNKDSLLIESEIQYKNGKKHGLAKKYNEKGWLESETQYKDGLKHGFETKYNSDGTIASQKYYENGVNCTMVHKALKKAWKKVATKRIDKEKAIEAETGVKTRLPKMGKGAKVVAMVKESIGLSK